MKIEYSENASYQRFRELPEHTKFITSDLVEGNQTYIKLGDVFMDSNRVNAFNLDDETFYNLADDTPVHIPRKVKIVVEF